MASEASITIRENIFQSGSSSKFQCERLFGSFQSIAASTMILSSFADVNFIRWIAHNLEAGTPQHGLHARTIGNPPVCWIVGIAAFDKVHNGITRAIKNLLL